MLTDYVRDPMTHPVKDPMMDIVTESMMDPMRNPVTDHMMDPVTRTLRLSFIQCQIPDHFGSSSVNSQNPELLREHKGR